MTIDGKIITADEGRILVKGDIKSREVILGICDSKENWTERDMDDSEISELKAEQEKLFKEKIAELKQQLFDTDYKAIKYAEGWLSEEEFAPVKAERQAIREQINGLESAIA